MKPFALIACLLCASTATTFAKPIVFDFQDPKKVNNVIFQMDAPLEAINGSAMGISGKVSYDPAAPAKTKGAIHLATATLHVGNPTSPTRPGPCSGTIPIWIARSPIDSTAAGALPSADFSNAPDYTLVFNMEFGF